MCKEAEEAMKPKVESAFGVQGGNLRERPDPKTLGEQIDRQIESTTNHLARLVKQRQDIRNSGHANFPLHLLHGDYMPF